MAAAICVSVVALAGCGGSEGVAEDAVVAAYVEAPLCEAAAQELARRDGRAGDLRVRAICLPGVRRGARLDLAAVGANARRATEDSTAIAYVEAPDPAAARFSHPILEAADIPWISASSGRKAMADLVRAIEAAGGSGSLREELGTELL